MKIVYGGQLLAAKPELTDRWHALIEEYRRDMENILSRAFLISESEWRENVTVMILIDRKRDEALAKVDEIDRAYEPRFRALAVGES